jgi:hypothetical protein
MLREAATLVVAPQFWQVKLATCWAEATALSIIPYSSMPDTFAAAIRSRPRDGTWRQGSPGTP